MSVQFRSINNNGRVMSIRTCPAAEANHAAILELMPSLSMKPGTFEVAFERWLELLHAASDAVIATAVSS